MPGTRCTPATSFGSSVRGTASFASAARSSSRPLRQVVKIRHRIAPSVSGIQPPVGTLVMLPATNARSTISSRPNSAATCHFGQFHCVAATKAPRMVVTTMVPTTAAP